MKRRTVNLINYLQLIFPYQIAISSCIMCFAVLLNQNLAIKGFRATTVEKIIQVILFEKMNSKVKIDEIIFRLMYCTLKSFIGF